MKKSKEELNELKQEYESLASKLSELSKEEIEQIVGGFEFDVEKKNPDYDINVYENKVEDPEYFKNKF